MISFDTLGINNSLTEGLKRQGILNPTAIQEKVIPSSLQNKNIIGQSQTGSGKTLAYLLPIFQRIHADKKEMQAIILAPTHELVMQIDGQIKLLSDNSTVPVTSAAIIGEVNIKRQIERLREKPHIITGSAGRILELIKMKKIHAHTIKTIVIDECDKLFDKDNAETVKAVIKTVMRDTQLMAFSATINDKTLTSAKEIIKDAKVIKIQDENIPLINSSINHMYFVSEQRDKIEILRKLIASIKPEKAIVFLNKRDEIEITSLKLQYHHINSSAIYGSASKEDRKRTLEAFRTGKLQILIASDLAARGLDVKDVTHIFNLDLPADPKEYLHRVGRTGRFNKTGTAISIITEKEIAEIKKYEKLFKINISFSKIHNGKILNSNLKEHHQHFFKHN